VLALERDIAGLEWEDGTAGSSRRDKYEARFTLRELGAAMPGFDWNAWAKPQGIDRAAGIVLTRPAFFRGFAALTARVPLATWREWLVARYVTAAAPFLSAPFDTARFDFFGSVLTGQELPRVRWKRGVSMVSTYLGDALGRMYVERHFPPSSRKQARRLVDGILGAYREALREARWLRPAARREALARLASLSTGVGYPDEWRTYAALEIRRDDLFGNWLRALAFEGADRLRQGRPDAAGRWAQPPQTVNAAYAPAAHTILVPAAILQPPVFDPQGDDAANYGAAGALVAHEVTHAVESAFQDFDAAPLLEQLRALEPFPGLHVNVDAVARETAADIAGLSVAFRAYRASLGGRAAPVVDGLTGDQRFFLSWARMWRSLERDAYARSMLATSVHLPPRLRANVAAANVDGFSEAFAVQPDDRMFIAAARRVRIW
jgi:predicted metalloendopeptidase